MMVAMKSLLEEAQKRKYAIGSFNVYNYETIRGVIDAASDERVPVIVAFGERYLENMGLAEVASVTRDLCAGAGVPVVLHLDHCKSFDHIVQAVQAGFTSVMYDGSSLPYEENAATTHEVTRLAHAAGVSVEAELGAIGLGDRSNEEEASQIYTDPGQARDFVSRTGIDALAVSIGTVHGLYKGEPKINIDILKEICRIVQIPLVLHGGSGTPEEIIRQCIQNGICKINVNTEISAHVVDKLRELLCSGADHHLSQLSVKQVSLVKDVVKKYIRIFGGVA